MNISAAPASTMAMATAAQQLQTTMQAQVSMLQELAESQQEVARMLAEGGLGQTIDVRA
ncbi:hypothetical protein DSCA_31850 [Desulfosarcina alkanivorans]|jgi:hypothetical protein|uniref:Motility protein n=1 Tax=Desulfosarcina alkanivorans TaxID=571177 RepID=A0A5K7YLG2_9BACT|nr:hypothetical protein [Desulfosarcina alkanivorans]BBO69255.1 hypothetical protein DSCA_31850 [Desulfosarcina alkanivorans]